MSLTCEAMATTGLEQLGLKTAALQLDQVAQQAAAGQWSYTHFLGYLLVLSSNKAFAEWVEVFAGDAVMASAALDRLLHRATVLNIRGDSYRMKDRRRSGQPAEAASAAATDPSNPGPTRRTKSPSTVNRKETNA